VQEEVSEPRYVVERWTKDHDATGFVSDLPSIRKYIQEQVQRDVSSRASAVFVLTKAGEKIVRGYYSLSSISIVFSELSEEFQKRLPRYPEISGVLLGRLGVDKTFSIKQEMELRRKPRFGELLLVDVQERALAATREVGSGLMVIDAEMPGPEELQHGARDPLTFYTQYGFQQLTANPRRVVKTMRAIAKEFEVAIRTGTL